ncbi:MAG TPA: hypothetical protein VLT62_28750 [Candidatus Methylomirabilis sp.]|nr:hypothetical protein [Candidatus Methylomirabilis sp.]
MSAKKVLSDADRAPRPLEHDLDTRVRALKTRFKGRSVGLDEKLTPHNALRDHEPLRKMPPPDRRYWPSPNSQRAPRRPQAKKGSPR